MGHIHIGLWVNRCDPLPTLVYTLGNIMYFILGASTLVKCTEQVKETSLYSGQDGLLAIIDGNGSPDVPHILHSLLRPTLCDELERSPFEENEMLYLEHTFLTLHRYSSSLVNTFKFFVVSVRTNNSIDAISLYNCGTAIKNITWKKTIQH